MEEFHTISGLKLNKEKTEARWMGNNNNNKFYLPSQEETYNYKYIQTHITSQCKNNYPYNN